MYPRQCARARVAQVLDLHIEDTRRPHAHGLDDAEAHLPVLDVMQPDDIHLDVRIETRGLYDMSATLHVRRLELLAGFPAREGGMRLAAGEAEREAEPRLLDLLSRPYVHETKLDASPEAQIEVPTGPGGPAAVIATVVAVGGHGHLEAELLLIGDLRL